jgi:isopenicillin N synthase-like dioxygenase
MLNTRQVPELSLLSYVNGSSQDQVKFVDQLFRGIKDYGFIILTDHTVGDEKVKKAYDLAHEFFNLSEETKRQYHVKGGGGQRGYTPFKAEHAKDNPNPDLKEFWHVGREFAAGSKELSLYPENLWPKEVAEFKKVFTELYSAMDITSKILLDAIGRALDVRPTFFSEMVSQGNSILRLIHYPPTKNQDTEKSIRAAAHEDINLITLLVGATDSGLELKDRDGTWLSVNSKPGQIVVDSGDMLSRITNELIPATTHRVVNPKDNKSARYSMPFFTHPNSDAVLECIPSCLGSGAKFKPILADDFLKERLRALGLY